MITDCMLLNNSEQKITIAFGLNNEDHSALKLFTGLTIAAFIDS